MATTLSYGYINPENGDRGSVWFPALNTNIVRLNGHTHDGVDSALLPASSVTNASASVAAVDWTADGTGRFKQTVSCPAGYNMDDYAITVKISGGDMILASVERASLTTFIIYTLDNSLDYEVIFS